MTTQAAERAGDTVAAVVESATVAAEAAIESAEERAEAAEEMAELIAAAAMRDEIVRRVAAVEERSTTWQSELESLRATVQSLTTECQRLAAEMAATILRLPPILPAPEPAPQPSIPPNSEVTETTVTEATVNPAASADGLPVAEPEKRKRVRLI